MSASKVYFITGANRGIGFQVVKQLSEKEPNSLIIGSTRSTAANQLTKLAESSKNVKIVTLDVSSEESIAKLDDQLSKVAPTGIDVFISNAGIAEVETTDPLLKVSTDVFLRHYRTNALGPILITKVVYPYLQKRPTKLISFTSTLAATVSGPVIFPTSAYGQSKAALNHSVRILAAELKDEGFTVIALHPGVVNTDMISVAHKVIETNPSFKEFLESALISPEESAEKQIEVYSRLTKEDTDKFFTYDGSVTEW